MVEVLQRNKKNSEGHRHTKWLLSLQPGIPIIMAGGTGISGGLPPGIAKGGGMPGTKF